MLSKIRQIGQRI